MPAATASPPSRAFYLFTTAESAVLYFGSRLKVFGPPKIKMFGTLSLLEELSSQCVQLAGRSNEGERRARYCVELTWVRQWKAPSFGSHCAIGFFQYICILLSLLFPSSCYWLYLGGVTRYMKCLSMLQDILALLSIIKEIRNLKCKKVHAQRCLVNCKQTIRHIA